MFEFDVVLEVLEERFLEKRFLVPDVWKMILNCQVI